VRKTILFVSHDLNEAMKRGDRIAIMEGGRIVQQGAPEDIMLRPAGDYVAEFVRHINPVTVLRANHVMRPVAVLERQGDTCCLDIAGLYEAILDGGDGLDRLRHAGMPLAEQAFARVAPDISLREVARHR